MPSGIYDRSKMEKKEFCKRGHKIVISGKKRRCLQCARIQNKASNERYPERFKIQRRNTSWRGEHILNKDGEYFTTIDYDKAFEEQNGRCKICAKHRMEFRKDLCVDHDHSTGMFRALLCYRCNLKVGLAENAMTNGILGYLKLFGLSLT